MGLASFGAEEGGSEIEIFSLSSFKFTIILYLSLSGW